MPMKSKSRFLYAYNAIFVVLSVAAIFIAANFWMGSKEQFDELTTNKAEYFFNRFALNGFLSLILSTFLFLINKAYKYLFKLDFSNIRLLKIGLIELLIFLGSSVVFILIGM